MDEINEKIKEYELAFLLRDAGDRDQLFNSLKKAGAQIYDDGQINQLRLMYPIKKEQSAFFGYCYFKADPGEVFKLKNELDLVPQILRYLIITPPIMQSNRQPKSESREPQSKPDIRKPEKVLTNEALEQKLEEILK